MRRSRPSPDESRLLESVRKALRHAEGTYGIVVMALDLPGELVTARKGSPLILGLGDGENLVASDVAAIVSRTQSVVYLKDGEIAHLTAGHFSISTLDEAEDHAGHRQGHLVHHRRRERRLRALHGEGDL
jgi:glucosamine--fructose-6-phosphate aminotransferase (isomerizing)